MNKEDLIWLLKVKNKIQWFVMLMIIKWKYIKNLRNMRKNKVKIYVYLKELPDEKTQKRSNKIV